MIDGAWVRDADSFACANKVRIWPIDGTWVKQMKGEKSKCKEGKFM